MKRKRHYLSVKSTNLPIKAAALSVLAAGALALNGCGGVGGGPGQPVPGGSGSFGTVVFSSLRDGNSEIYTVVPGTNDPPKRLTADQNAPLPSDTEPSFSGDGNKIAWISSRDFTPADVWIMDSTGANQVPVTRTSLVEADPALNNDGTKVAFVRLVGAGNTGNNIFVKNIATGAEIRLTNSPGFGAVPNTESHPYFSPDGTKIVYVSNAAGVGTQEIFITNSDGTGTPTRLTTDGGTKSSPRFSRDGQRIVYSHNNEIWVMNVNGTGQTQLTNNAAIDDSPAFGPNDTRIVFQTDRDGPANPAGGRYTEIYTMAANGTDPVRVTNNGPVNDNTPDWR